MDKDRVEEGIFNVLSEVMKNSSIKRRIQTHQLSDKNKSN